MDARKTPRPLHAYRPKEDSDSCSLCPCPAIDHPDRDAEPMRSLYATEED
jgi:hypothetical protein